MYDVNHYKKIFDRYNGLMRSKQLDQEQIYYRQLQRLICDGYVEKLRTGYYRWNDDDGSEAGVIMHLFPDGIFCMDTALRHYGYSDRTPREWHIAVSKDSGKYRFQLEFPFIHPYYIEPTILNLGLREDEMDGHLIHIYDKERVICDCLRYRNKMDKEIFNKAIRSYVEDPTKRIPKLMEYAESLRIKKVAQELIGIWL